jgi:hypothetical protein
MEMEVGIELLVPGMQDGDESPVSAQAVSGVTAEAQEALGDGVKEDREHGFLSAQHNGVKLVGEREYGVNVAHGQKLCLAGFEPSFARDVLAGVIGDPLSATVIAVLNAAAERGRSAGDELGYDLVLRGLQGYGSRYAVICSRRISASSGERFRAELRFLLPGGAMLIPSFLVVLIVGIGGVERAFDLGQGLPAHMHGDHGRG